jgi:ribonuclease P protein component
MSFSYPKNHKLKSKRSIDLLFSKGKSVSKYPLRLVYTVQNEQLMDGELIKMGVSVSKKYFKHAVDRNYFKRVLRETYRLHQDLLREHLNEPYIFMFFYQTKDRLSYAEIEQKTIQLFEKWADELQKKDNATEEIK